MLKETNMNEEKEVKKRKIILITFVCIAILSVIITMIIQIIQLTHPQKVVEEKPKEVEVIEFNKLFDNKINMQNNTVNNSYKNSIDKDIVYTNYDINEKEDHKYELKVSIPEINIKNDKIDEINKEIVEIFQTKANNIIEANSKEEVIYTVEYSAYVNSNILSLVIKSTLKEGRNAQRLIVKGYTYNISTGEVLNLNDMILIKKLDTNEIEKSINAKIKKSIDQSSILINLGYQVYERKIDDEMYRIENINNVFYGPNGVLYIIFAYGNNNFTSEIDVVTIK